ncbi:MAG: helix-turn-helix domain-containing protein, partial [Alphaproteobacteria bacterium]|nr:helix-turn-helix domain-containing protein [Alphaproteobacteria bacterium]
LPAAKHHSGMSDIISDFFLSIDRNGMKLNSQEVQHVVERALDLLGVFLFNEESSATLYSSALLRRIKLFVETNYSNPDLDVRAIADAHGISNRYVHALFKSSRYSVSSYLWERRLQACRQQFEKPAFRNWSISQIAFANGFSDAAHFSRAFKKRFGVRATDYRKRPGGRA